MVTCNEIEASGVKCELFTGEGLLLFSMCHKFGLMLSGVTLSHCLKYRYSLH